MDICFNEDARFTKWVVSTHLLREPFVVIDVGVQGGENVRWHVLGDSLVLHGFDAIEEVVAELNRHHVRQAHRHYHWMAIGSEDGDRDFFFRTDDPFSSSLYQPGIDRYRLDGQATWQSRRVPVRRLDTLLEQGAIPRADFLKIDVEGYEKHVLLGAPRLLASTLGIEIETNFGTSPEYPKSHFGTVLELLIAHGLLVFDLNFNRIPRASFLKALRRARKRTIKDQASVGRASTFNVLYCRDFTEEADHPDHFPTPRSPFTLDQIVKLMMIYELHGLNDMAVDTVERFRDRLTERLLDVDEAIHLLANPNCRAPKHRWLRSLPLRLHRTLATRLRRLIHAPGPSRR